jgi:hypothetical protein
MHSRKADFLVTTVPTITTNVPFLISTFIFLRIGLSVSGSHLKDPPFSQTTVLVCHNQKKIAGHPLVGSPSLLESAKNNQQTLNMR